MLSNKWRKEQNINLILKFNLLDITKINIEHKKLIKKMQVKLFGISKCNLRR